MKYASDTSVPADRSRGEIEKTLVRYGAGSFMYGWEDSNATIGFRMQDKLIKFVLPLPSPQDYAVAPKGRNRSPGQAEAACEQGVRQRWRALNLVIKAKLEAVECEISSFEEEFLPYIVLPNGQTVGSWAIPQVRLAYEDGKMPQLRLGA